MQAVLPLDAFASRRSHRPVRRILLTLPVVAIVLAAWFALAPPQLGGSTSLAITSGTSMLPNFRAGDLVLLRKQSSYHVGVVAGYRNGELGVTVMHRIIAVDGNQFVFKGDHNT